MGRKYQKNREFQELAKRINKAIVKNDGLPKTTKERDALQKAQVEKLYELEKSFKTKLLYYPQTYEIYEKFIKFIKEDKGNILTAQPYFRESGKTFQKEIATVIKEDLVDALTTYDVNAMFAMFVMENWRGEFPKRIQKTYNALLDVRRMLIENNLPLAINEAKKFFRKTPKDHLDLLDFIDIATYGLVSGIDKFVGPYTKTWRSVCLGRMTGFMIEEYSKTFIRMYPSEKKILYRANSLKYRMKIENVDDLVKAVNESFEKDKRSGSSHPKDQVTAHQINSLMNSSSYWSADTKPQQNGVEDESLETVYEYYQDDSLNPEEELIKNDLIARMLEATDVLDLMEKKVIQLKGVEI